MRIVNIFGGLGNQMFQYALMKALEERFHEPVLADVHLFHDYTRHNGLEIERIFPIQLSLAPKDSIQKLAFYAPTYNTHKLLKWLHIKKPSTIQEILSKPFHEDVFRIRDTYYDGYWQDPEYFINIKHLLSECFTFKLPLDGKNKEIHDTICSSDSVGIHVRRGDYLKKARYRGVCDLEYYTRAIQQVLQEIRQPHFYFFSNDMEWCKENLTPLLSQDKYTFVDWNKGTESYIDMQLMTQCKSLIIANSSFSWWAAYLNKRAELIIAPKIWFNTTPPIKIQLDSWLLI